MRLIDADTLLERTAELEAVALEQVRKYEPLDNPREWCTWSAILTERTGFKHDLMDAPIVDAVEVVRCKDCKYYEETDSRIGTCLLTISGAEVGGFCAWGEWRGDIGCAVTVVDESDKPTDDDFCSWGERREQ